MGRNFVPGWIMPTLCDPMNYSPSGFPVHGIIQAKILEWVAISYSRESSWHRDQTCVSLSLLLWQVGSLPLLPLGKPMPKPQCSSVQFSLVAQSCPTVCNPMIHKTPGLPVHHQLPEFTQTHVHQVSDAIQPSHPLSSPSPLAPIPSSIRVFSMNQLFALGGQSIGASASASVLSMNTLEWSPLGWTGWISLQSKRLSRVFSNTTVQKHQFFTAQLSSLSNSHSHTWPQ